MLSLCLSAKKIYPTNGLRHSIHFKSVAIFLGSFIKSYLVLEKRNHRLKSIQRKLFMHPFKSLQ